MACKKCNDCLDNGCVPIVYPKCIVTTKAYTCLGVPVGKTGVELFDAIEVACNAGWGGSNLTFNNGLTKTGNLVQLGGLLVKDTLIDANTSYKLEILGNFGANTVNGLRVDPNGLGAGNPISRLSTQNIVTNDRATIGTGNVGGVYFASMEAINAAVTQEAAVNVTATQAIMKYSHTGGGANYRKVVLDSTGITLDGLSAAGGLPTMLDLTQLQENAGIIAVNANLPITTEANTFLVVGAANIVTIDSTPAVGTVQPGTKITLEFDTVGTVVSHDATGALSDGILLNGCVDFLSSPFDTLTLVCKEYSPGGTRYWNEIGRKQCYTGLESWKNLDAAGTMINGEAIPTSGGSLTAFIARLRHQDSVHVEIQVTGVASIGALGAITLFTLPITANGIAYRPVAPLAYNVTGMNTTTGVPYTGQIQITPGGAVNFTVQDVIPPGAAEDHDVAFIISIPLD